MDPVLTKVMVTGRQGGKTQALIKWLIDGHPIERYPGWSRVILCATAEQVVHVTQRVRQATADFPETAATWDMRKAVWTLGDLTGGLNFNRFSGTDRLEIGIDDAELLLQRFLGFRSSLSFVTMTGETAPAPEQSVNPEILQS